MMAGVRLLRGRWRIVALLSATESHWSLLWLMDADQVRVRVHTLAKSRLLFYWSDCWYFTVLRQSFEHPQLHVELNR